MSKEGRPKIYMCIKAPKAKKEERDTKNTFSSLVAQPINKIK